MGNLVVFYHYTRIPLKTITKPPAPQLPQGRSRQKMVANIINTGTGGKVSQGSGYGGKVSHGSGSGTKVSRSHSVPASARPPVSAPVRPPFTSFSTAPSTPGAVKKGINTLHTGDHLWAYCLQMIAKGPI